MQNGGQFHKKFIDPDGQEARYEPCGEEEPIGSANLAVLLAKELWS